MLLDAFRLKVTRCLREQDPHAMTADVSVEGRGSTV